MLKEAFSKRAAAFSKDYAGAVRAMVKELFHPDADPALVAEAERRMLRTSPETARGMFAGMVNYDSNASARQLAVPLRAINGDLYPTDIEKIRKVKADFDVILMKHMGHYPMMERPDEFNALVRKVVAELEKRRPSANAGVGQAPTRG
jgi:pimeloyl-ACP methyl ester carboxylesterase